MQGKIDAGFFEKTVRNGKNGDWRIGYLRGNGVFSGAGKKSCRNDTNDGSGLLFESHASFYIN